MRCDGEEARGERHIRDFWGRHDREEDTCDLIPYHVANPLNTKD